MTQAQIEEPDTAMQRSWFGSWMGHLTVGIGFHLIWDKKKTSPTT